MPTSSRPATEGEGDPQSQPQAVAPGAAMTPLFGESWAMTQGRQRAAPNSRCPEEARATGTVDRLGDLLDRVKYW